MPADTAVCRCRSDQTFAIGNRLDTGLELLEPLVSNRRVHVQPSRRGVRPMAGVAAGTLVKVTTACFAQVWETAGPRRDKPTR
jgi:hypothetical protein